MILLLICVPGDAFSEDNADTATAQIIDLAKWGIYKDGTHPIETTKGINAALASANKSGIKATTLPPGTYLIDKDSRINMVSDMKFALTSDVVLQKETNGREKYELMYIGYGVKNVTLSGGVYVGDRKTHDYSKKDSTSSSGTHEGGYGISTEGASNIVIENVKAIDFTGDGLILGGYGTMITDLYEGSFVSGGMNSLGIPVKNAAKIRTKTALTFKNPIFKTEKLFELSNFMKVPRGFEVYFYRLDGSFLKKVYAQARNQVEIPAGADHFHLVFSQTSLKGVYLEAWSRVATRNVIVKNSEFAFNRRQGITVGGADKVLIRDSVFHDMKGTAPQSGIDVEGGFQVNGYFNSNITIRNNEFYNNAAYDVILYDGEDAVVEGNHLGSKDRIGIAVSDPFKNARVANNHFDGSRIIAENDALFVGNRMNDSSATFQGPNIVVDGLELTDSRLMITAKESFGLEISNVTLINNKKADTGLVLWGKPIRLHNLTISGEGTLRSLTGGGAGGSIFENLRVLGYNSTYGLTLPPGTYNNCVFEAAEGSGMGSLTASMPGSYIFSGCSFKSNTAGAGGLYGEQTNLDFTVKGSTFEMQRNSTAINVQAAQSAVIENNIISALTQTANSIELIKINSYWTKEAPSDILSATIRGNTITSNMQAFGISTQYAGKNAPPYVIENNTLTKAKIVSKPNDQLSNNTLLP
ncbi:right-handed parallel beta-helix repeat-containing protein [Paenibacillus wynnii]|uniref:right-handed parallel beta-helix repeat-containing protein n=1 Tax=Paenibacillus wynnii TaxID=268407 RepID=UPI00278FE1E6|nr:right-handed parallel beta-helix repeat-containing protein [Paenibacillus wynnii]MDQ0194123.1 hypothetical protein [Paenibacillus wynnii]